MKRKGLLLLITSVMFLAQACYYDKEEELYPPSGSCDTTNVTYSGTVFPVISNSCTSCHTGIGAGGNISLDSYESISAAANNGSLLGVIRHESGWSPMPKNAGKLDDCTIKKLEIWINNGTPNN
jgi:hypothetical protein